MVQYAEKKRKILSGIQHCEQDNIGQGMRREDGTREKRTGLKKRGKDMRREERT
jgi:hypothetical protein